LDHPGGIPQSLLAVPLLTGDHASGVISVFDFSEENAFDEVQQELLSTIASQTATSIENADLFAEIRNALGIIEVRERLQKNVTQAVAALTSKGTAATREVLEALANAANCQRAYYAVPSVDSEGQPVWQLKALFDAPLTKKGTSPFKPQMLHSQYLKA
jgi:GAF domain-containing protein